MESLKLFFSYGHEERNQPIIELIRNKLENERHHKVWIDTKSIAHSADWRREIQEGITSSNSVVAFLSRYAMRKTDGHPGVCLDELSIAVCTPEVTIVTILLEPEKEVNAPPTISSIQRLDMSDWKEKYEIGGKEFENYFNEKFALILEAVESDKTFRFHGEVEGLRKSLLPETGKSRYYDLLSKPMIGREWLTDIFAKYLADRNTDRFFCIFGGPGYGKSQFVANAIHYNPQVVAGYFFEWNLQDAYSVKTFICSIAFQMATMLPDYRCALIQKLKENGRFLTAEEDGDRLISNLDWLREKTDAALFSFLITDIVLIDGQRDNKLVVVDGVDEAVYRGKNPLAELLCSDVVQRLPSWLKILLTAREEEEIRLLFQKLEAKEISLDRSESKTDIERYLHFRLDGYIEKGDISEDIIDKITNRCENTFIFAEKLCDAYELDPTILSAEDRLPKNINGLYFDYFNRLFQKSSYDEVKVPLALLAANNGEMSVSIFKQILEWDDARLTWFLELMRSFIRNSVDENKHRIVFYHKTMNEWIVDRYAAGKYSVDKEQGKKRILQYCARCQDGLEKAPFSWGFNGSKTALSFETLQFVYSKILEFGDGSMKMRLQTDLRFLYDLQLEAYRNSELKLSEKIAMEIKDNYSFMSKREQREKERYYAGSVILLAEIELARGNKEAIQLFEKAEEQFSECLKNEPALYGCTERNICFLQRKIDKEAAEMRLRKLMDDLAKKEYPEKYSDIAQFNYHLSVNLYDQQRYEDALIAAQNAIRFAQRFNEEPARLCVLAYNQIGSCYQKLCALSNDPIKRIEFVKLQNEYKQKSLDERLLLYGKYSRYTANAYDYMARAILDLCREKQEPLNALAYEYVENAIKITSYIFGVQSSAYARTLQTKAILLEYDNKKEDALYYAEQALRIYLSYGDFEKKAIETTQKIVSRLSE